MSCAAEWSSSFWNEATENRAFHLSLISSMVTTFVGISGVTSWAKTGSSLMLGLGIVNLVECMRNFVILWRFSSTEEEEIELTRDEKSSLLITSLMLIAGICMIAFCILDYTMGMEEADFHIIFYISIPSYVFFALLGTLKLRYAKLLTSSALLLDGTSSMITSLFSLFLTFTTLIIIVEPSAWWLDPTIGLILGLLYIMISLDVLYMNVVRLGIPCFSFTFWSSPVYDRVETGGLEFNTQEMFTIL